jgi:hypothetical protein
MGDTQMTEQPAAPAAKQEAPAGPPAVPAAAGPPAPLTPDEERQLGELIAKRDAATMHTGVRVRITSAHSELRYGGTTVTHDWSMVPVVAIGPLESAAYDAGVDIEQEGV